MHDHEFVGAGLKYNCLYLPITIPPKLVLETKQMKANGILVSCLDIPVTLPDFRINFIQYKVALALKAADKDNINWVSLPNWCNDISKCSNKKV